MADTTTIPRQADDRLDGGPTIRPRRPLPGSRAVVGALLVVLAAVGTFGAYLQATAAPTTTYLVATAELRVGQVLDEGDVSAMRAIAVELPEEQAGRAVPAGSDGLLVGTVVVAPVNPGDLLLRSAVQPVGTAASGVQLSFSLPPDRAVGGSVAVGERVDVIATFSRGQGETSTEIVARQVTIVAAPPASEGIGGGRVVLTVQVPDLATAQAIQRAVDVADVALLRGADPDAPDPRPADGVQRPSVSEDGLATGASDPSPEADGEGGP